MVDESCLGAAEPVEGPVVLPGVADVREPTPAAVDQPVHDRGHRRGVVDVDRGRWKVLAEATQSGERDVRVCERARPFVVGLDVEQDEPVHAGAQPGALARLRAEPRERDELVADLLGGSDQLAQERDGEDVAGVEVRRSQMEAELPGPSRA